MFLGLLAFKQKISQKHFFTNSCFKTGVYMYYKRRKKISDSDVNHEYRRKQPRSLESGRHVFYISEDDVGSLINSLK